MVCSLMLLNELSSRIGTKQRWQAKLTLTLVFDISDCTTSDSQRGLQYITRRDNRLVRIKGVPDDRALCEINRLNKKIRTFDLYRFAHKEIKYYNNKQ